jgi:hypothetical protein
VGLGKGYINNLRTGNRIVLFVRENKKKDGMTSLYFYFGEVKYVSYEGNMPTSFVWRLKEEIVARVGRVTIKSIV